MGILREITKGRVSDGLFDLWSIPHFGVSAVLSYYLGPLPASVIMTVWEGLEATGQYLQNQPPQFWNETPHGRWIGDIMVNELGVLVGYGIKESL